MPVKLTSNESVPDGTDITIKAAPRDASKTGGNKLPAVVVKAPPT
jgi:hypothetical protein